MNVLSRDTRKAVLGVVRTWRKKYYPHSSISSADPLQLRSMLQAAKAIPSVASATRLLLGNGGRLATVLHPYEFDLLYRTARIADHMIEIARRARKESLTTTDRIALKHTMYPYSRFLT